MLNMRFNNDSVATHSSLYTFILLFVVGGGLGTRLLCYYVDAFDLLFKRRIQSLSEERRAIAAPSSFITIPLIK